MVSLCRPTFRIHNVLAISFQTVFKWSFQCCYCKSHCIIWDVVGGKKEKSLFEDIISLNDRLQNGHYNVPFVFWTFRTDGSFQDPWTDVDWAEIEEQDVHPLLVVMKFWRNCRFKQVHFILTSRIFAKWISLFISIFLSFISPKFTLPFSIWSVRQSVAAFHCFYITSSFSVLSQQFPILTVIFLRWIHLLPLRFDWHALKFRCCQLNSPSLCELPFEDIRICRV